MASVDAGQIPAFYDRVHHGDGQLDQHVFFVQGSAAHHLGLCTSSADFVNVETKEVWTGFDAYKPADGAFVKSVEAFAYSSCFSGMLLLALRLASNEDEKQVKEWMILQLDLTSESVEVASCEGFLSCRSLQAATDDLASLLSHLRPHQSLEAILAWSEVKGRQCFTLQHLGVKWSGLQGSRLESFVGAHPRSQWRERVEVALTGREDAFPELGVCKIEDAMLVQKRVFWKTQDLQKRAVDVPNAVQLTFVAFCRFPEPRPKIWSLRVRHLYNPQGASELWDLRPDERVRGTLYLEWKQVGSSQDFVLRDVEKTSTARSLLAVQMGDGVEKEVNLFEGGAVRWVEIWRQEDLKKDLSQCQIWIEHLCNWTGVVEILDDDRDVTAIVKSQLLRVDGQKIHRVKNEMLNDRLKEKITEQPDKKKAILIEDFNDPYAEACQKKRQKLEMTEKKDVKVPSSGSKGEQVEEEVKGSKNKKGHEEWSESWSWKEPRAWGKKRWGNDWYGGRGSAAPLPPPPPPPLLRTVASSGCVRSFCHLSQTLPHVYGEAAAEERLKPLVEMRKLLETCSVVTVGREQEFQERMRSLVWDCLPHLKDDGSFWNLLEQALQECGIHPLEHYGLSQQVLSCYSREDVQAVFTGFAPASGWLRSTDYTTLCSVSMDKKMIERLATWVFWLKALEGGPRIELFKICLKELPASWVNITYTDGHGYHMPLLRLSDLERYSVKGGDKMGWGLLEEFENAVLKHASALFDMSSCWWSTAMWNACCWSVQYMERPKGRVDLEMLGGYFQRINGVSRQFRKEALDLIVRIQDVQSERQMPKSFNLGKGDFLYAESASLVSFPAPKWPFE